GLEAARAERFDAAILDVMLPKLDGISLLEKLRSEGQTLPIIVLSALDSVEHKIKGLESGGDDYLAKPFSVSELIARVQSLLRRASRNIEDAMTLTVGDLTMDLKSRKVFRGGERIELQPLEFQLLEYLVRNRGRVVSKTGIMEHVWEYDFDPGTNVVESRVCRLREKIDKGRARKLIHTVRGFGYVVEER
ncbi:MAG: response regulator transcription factor, partial [Kiritimatiellia bacterium]